jgi:hypothetical protein
MRKDAPKLDSDAFQPRSEEVPYHTPYTPGGWKPALEAGQPQLMGGDRKDTVSLASFLDLKSQLRQERQQRRQAEKERDDLKTTLANVLEGTRGG